MAGPVERPSAESRDLQRRLRRAPPSEDLVAQVLAHVRAALSREEGAEVAGLLDTLIQRRGATAQMLELLGHAHRQAQDLGAAGRAFAAARRLAPAEPMLALAAAQTQYERGLSAAGDFLHAADLLAPNRPDVRRAALRNAAQAMVAEGDAAAAEALLQRELARQPDWLEGHRVLASLLWVTGGGARFADSYSAALAARPDHRPLWLGWFQALAQVRAWPQATEVLDRAEAACGEGPDLRAARLFVATESGAAADEVSRLLELTADLQGDGVNLCRVRALLRQGRGAEVVQLALPLTRGPSAMTFWPYLSLAWRLTGDSRAAWLDGEPPLARAVEVDLAAGERRDLAARLRELHTLSRPYAEQSVRGGTQTDRSLLLRDEPLFRRLRRKLLDAMAAYVADLPPHEAGHPLLGLRRDRLLVEGSWSVRLTGQGHNVAHTHPVGWLSSAFYVSLPPPEQMGPAPAGWIAFGEPPPELGLPLTAYAEIEPRPGRLAVFPSYMWHCTRPFADGERLVVAFDARRGPAV